MSRPRFRSIGINARLTPTPSLERCLLEPLGFALSPHGEPVGRLLAVVDGDHGGDGERLHEVIAMGADDCGVDGANPVNGRLSMCRQHFPIGQMRFASFENEPSSHEEPSCLRGQRQLVRRTLNLGARLRRSEPLEFLAR